MCVYVYVYVYMYVYIYIHTIYSVLLRVKLKLSYSREYVVVYQLLTVPFLSEVGVIFDTICSYHCESWFSPCLVKRTWL